MKRFTPGLDLKQFIFVLIKVTQYNILKVNLYTLFSKLCNINLRLEKQEGMYSINPILPGLFLGGGGAESYPYVSQKVFTL